eukprot:33521_1
MTTSDAIYQTVMCTISAFLLTMMFIHYVIQPMKMMEISKSEYEPYEHNSKLKAKWVKVRLSFGDTYYRIHTHHKEFDRTNTIPLILIHGISYSDVWCYFITEYLKLSNVASPMIVEYHLYGRGSSDSPLVRNNMQLFVTQLSQLLLHLNLNDTVNIIGFSMGGAIAMQFSCLYPQKINKLILISPSCMTPKTMIMWMIRNIPLVPDLLIGTLRKIGISKLKQFVETDGFYIKQSEIVQNQEVNSQRRQIMKDIANRWFGQMQQNKHMLWSLLSTLRYFPLCNNFELIKNVAQSINVKRIFIIWPQNDTICHWYNGGNLIHKQLNGSKLQLIENSDHNDTLTPYGLTFCLNNIDMFLSQYHT